MGRFRIVSDGYRIVLNLFCVFFCRHRCCARRFVIVAVLVVVPPSRPSAVEQGRIFLLSGAVEITNQRLQEQTEQASSSHEESKADSEKLKT